MLLQLLYALAQPALLVQLGLVSLAQGGFRAARPIAERRAVDTELFCDLRYRPARTVRTSATASVLNSSL